jgi:hypothetical protein
MPRHPILPLLLSAIAAAGCGGSSQPTHSVAGQSTSAASGTGTAGPLSPSAYHAKVNAAIAPWDVAIHGLRGHVTAIALREVATTAKQGAREIAALNPPPAVANLQTQLVATLNQNALHAGRWAQAVQNHDSAAAARLAGAFRQDGRTILKLDNEYKAKGVTL